MNNESPSRYETLAKLSVEHFQDHNARKEQAEQFAFDLIKKFIEYLGCPREQVTHVPIDRDSFEILSPDESGRLFVQSVPDLTYHDDGFWYFGIAIKLELDEQPMFWVTQCLKFGIRPNQKSFEVRHGNDTTIDVDMPNSQVNTFFETIFEQMMADYDSATRDPSRRKRIGFAPPAAFHTRELDKNTT